MICRIKTKSDDCYIVSNVNHLSVLRGKNKRYKYIPIWMIAQTLIITVMYIIVLWSFLESQKGIDTENELYYVTMHKILKLLLAKWK